MEQITVKLRIRDRKLVIHAHNPEHRLLLMQLTGFDLKISRVIEGVDAVEEIEYTLVPK